MTKSSYRGQKNWVLAHDFTELTATKTKSPPFDTNYKAATETSVAAFSNYAVFGFSTSIEVFCFSIFANKFPATSAARFRASSRRCA